MLYITGDIHGDAVSRFSYKKNPFLREMGENDYAIILGDFGLPFGIEHPNHVSIMDEVKYNLSFLSSKKATILALAGNHDDRDFISTLPQIPYKGGKVRKMVYNDTEYPTIFYIDESTILTLDNKQCLFIPGAESHDINDGILDPDASDFYEKMRYLNNTERYFYRIKHWEWWEDEDIDIAKTQELLTDKPHIDLIFSHDTPFPHLFPYDFRPTIGEQYLRTIRVFDYPQKDIRWYHGHMHKDIQLTSNTYCLYHTFAFE